MQVIVRSRNHLNAHDLSDSSGGSRPSIGSSESRCFVEIGEYRGEMTKSIPVHGVAVEACISQLTDPTHGCIKDASEISAIGFKAVHGGRLSGVQRIDEKVLAAM